MVNTQRDIRSRDCFELLTALGAGPYSNHEPNVVFKALLSCGMLVLNSVLRKPRDRLRFRAASAAAS